MSIDSMAHNAETSSNRTAAVKKLPPRQSDRQFIADKAKKFPDSNDFMDKNDGDLQAIVTQLNQFIIHLRRDVRFSVNQKNVPPMIDVIDSESGEMIRQINPDNFLAVSKLMADSLKSNGILVEEIV